MTVWRGATWREQPRQAAASPVTPSGPPGDTERPEEPGDRRARLAMLFTVVTLALLMQSIDTTIVATALHALQEGLGTTVNWAGWTITVYSVALLLMLPLSARLSERFGRKKIFLLSVAAFGLASLCCGLANDIFVLIVMRALQALGGAGLTPSATGIVVDNFGRARDKAVGLFGSVFQIGAMAGPVLGGLFVAYLNWRWIFFVNVPVSIALIVFGMKLIPHDPPQRASDRTSLDMPGMALLGTGILAGMVGVTFLGESGTHALAITVVALVVAVVLLWWFLRHTHAVASPFIAPHLIHGRGFGAVNMISVLYGGATVGVISLVPLYAVNRYQLGSFESGTLLTGQAAAGVVMSILGALALRRTGYRSPLYLGAFLCGAGMLALAFSPPGGLSAYLWLALASAVVGLGIGWSNPASRNAGLQLLPDQSASITALRAMGRRVGTIASVSVVTAIVAGSSSPGLAQAYAVAGFGVLLLVAAPIVARVPEHRGSW